MQGTPEYFMHTRESVTNRESVDHKSGYILVGNQVVVVADEEGPVPAVRVAGANVTHTYTLSLSL